jgi:diguanylate cyclase (GGDEF)-like protein
MMSQEIICGVIIVGLFSLTLLLLYRQNNFDRHLKKFIEFNNNITVITTQTDIVMVNSAGLHFFGFDSTKTLLKKTKYLSKLFTEVVNDDIKHIRGINWVTRISKKQHITVQMQNGSFKQTFTMQVSKINENRYMVTFHNISKVVAEKKEITQVAQKDELTRIYNRKKFNHVLASALRNAQVHQQKFSLIIFDIDHFKQVNDTYGHDIGDKVLIQIAALVKNLLYGHDTFARWGGEEFVILAEDTTKNDAYMLANRLREAIENFPFEFVKQLTCSFGISEYRPNDTETTLVKRADNALYQAKQNGRNRVCIES